MTSCYLPGRKVYSYDLSDDRIIRLRQYQSLLHSRDFCENVYGSEQFA